MLRSISSLKIVLALLGVIAILLVAMVAARVGGIAIRSTGSQSDQVTLDLSSPPLRGVPVTVRWSEEIVAGEIELIWRTNEGETFVGKGGLSTQAARAVFPCAGEENGSLVVRDVTSGKVHGSLPLTLLPPTADCLRSATP